MRNSKLIRVPPTAAVLSLGSLVTGGYEDLGSRVTLALLAGDTHQTQPLFMPPACQCLALVRPGRWFLIAPFLREGTTPAGIYSPFLLGNLLHICSQP